MFQLQSLKNKFFKKVLHKEDKRKLNKLIDGKSFDDFIMWLIFTNAVIFGLMTTDLFNFYFDQGLFLFNRLIMALFIAEISLRIYVKKAAYFKSGWNIFDVVVVGLAIVPPFSAIIIFRTFRLMKLLKGNPQWQKMNSVAQTFISLLPLFVSFLFLFLGLLFVFSVIGVIWYGDVFSDFATVGSSMLVMMQSFTIDAWSMDVARPVLGIFPSAWLFFTSLNLLAFLLLVSFVLAAAHQVLSLKK